MTELSDNKKKQLRAMRLLIADAFSFVRSQEINQALASVTLDQLMSEQIARNGESSDSERSVYNPYAYDTKADSETPASTGSSLVSPSFVTGVSAQATEDGKVITPSKLARLEAIKATLNEAINSYAEVTQTSLIEIDLEDQELDGPIEEMGTYDSDFVTNLAIEEE